MFEALVKLSYASPIAKKSLQMPDLQNTSEQFTACNNLSNITVCQSLECVVYYFMSVSSVTNNSKPAYTSLGRG